jgi:DNA-binding CsgD family transcriptional regulator
VAGEEGRRGSYSKSSAGKAQKAYRIAMRRRAVSLLMDQGLEQKEIAQRLGVSEGTVSGDVAAIKVEAIREAVAGVERMVAREALALDEDEEALRTMLGEAETAAGVMKGYETVLMIMRRRAELLGLDAQQRRKQKELDGAADDLDALLERVMDDEELPPHEC